MNPIVDDLVAVCRAFGLCERDVVCDGDVSVQQCVTLQALLTEPKEVRQLADHVGSSPSAMTRLVDGLVGRGWVERVRDTHDRRRVRVLLTPAGRSKAEHLQGLTEQAVERALAAIPADKRDQVIESLSLLRQAMVPTCGERVTCCR